MEVFRELRGINIKFLFSNTRKGTSLRGTALFGALRVKIGSAASIGCSSLENSLFTLSRCECCKVDDASQWENWKFDPLPRPNPLTDRQEKLHTWLPWMSTDMQNLVAIPPGVSFPRMREIAREIVYSASFLRSSNDLQPRRLNRFSRVIKFGNQYV